MPQFASFPRLSPPPASRVHRTINGKWSNGRRRDSPPRWDQGGPRQRFARWQVAIVVRDGVVGFLPWPASRRWSWERSAARRLRLRRSARKRDPSRDTADTGPNNRGRTFYRVKRQLGDAKPRPCTRTPFATNPKREPALFATRRLLTAGSSAALGTPRSRSGSLGRARGASASVATTFAYRSAFTEANRLLTRQSRMTMRGLSSWNVSQIDGGAIFFPLETGLSKIDNLTVLEIYSKCWQSDARKKKLAPGKLLFWRLIGARNARESVRENRKRSYKRENKASWDSVISLFRHVELIDRADG